MLLSSLIGADANAPAGCRQRRGRRHHLRQPQRRPGYVFAAIAGSKADGARFIADAVAKGAVAVLAGQGRGSARRRRAGAARRRAAPPARAHGGALLWPAAAGYRRRRYRHQRQDVGRRLHAADLYGARAQERLARHHRPGQARCRRLRLAHHARSGIAAQDAGRARRRGRHASRLRGVLARPRSAPPRRRASSRRPASPISAATTSTIIRRVEAYLAAKLRLFSELLPRGRNGGDQCRRRRGGARAVEVARGRGPPRLHGRPRRRNAEARAAGARRLRAAHVGGARRPRVRHPPAAARRVPGFERARRRRPRHRHGRGCRTRAAGAAGFEGRQGPAGDHRRSARRPGRRRLRPQARSARRRSRRATPVRDRQAHLRHGLRRRSRQGQASDHGRHRRRQGRRRHRHRRQPAHREAGGDPRRNPRRRPGRTRDRRPRRGDRCGRRHAGRRRCSGRRRQGPRNRSDRRRQGAARSRTTTRSAKHWSTADRHDRSAVDVG